MNLITLTDTKLAALHSQAANEIARRAKAAINGHDAATIICGNEMAKRALLVAAAGDHSILFVGPPSVWQDHAAGRGDGTRPGQHLRGSALPVWLSR